jgi:predicted TIM-barrel fold metal-dependent hydrolase
MDIIDAHHHIWRQQDLPWLVGPMVPRVFGSSYEAIRRDYPISEYIEDVAGSDVVKSVYVQANWPWDRAGDEAAYVQQAADESGFPNAIVGYADLMSADVRPALDTLVRYPLMRGIRMQIHWHQNDLLTRAPVPDLPDNPLFRKNFSALADYNLSFELQVFASQMECAARLAADFPDTTLILQHCGMPEDLSEAGMAAWRAGLKVLAAQPNAVAKLSGLGTFVHRNDPDHIARICRETAAIFGPSRCLYGSNFPIEKLWTTYPRLIGAFRDAVADFPQQDQADIFYNTAERVYRLA